MFAFKGLGNAQLARVIQYGGLVTPIFLTLYGGLIEIGAIANSHYSGYFIFGSITTIWLIVALMQYFSPAKGPGILFLRLAFYHVCMIMYLLFVSGFNTPLVGFWILLFLASSAYFGKKGLLTSLFVFFATACTSIILSIDTANIIFFESIGTTTAVAIVGGVALFLLQASEMNFNELQATRDIQSAQRDRVISIVNNMNDAVLSVDNEGIVRLYNAAAMALLDTNDSLNGKKLDALLKLTLPDDTKIGAFSLFQKQNNLSKNIVRDDLRFSYDDGDELKLEVTFSPIRGTYARNKHKFHSEGIVIILRDITKAKTLEEERDEFISVISHELRTPLTIAEGTLSNAEILASRPEFSLENMKSALKNSHDQIIFLSKMVNDLSTLSRAQRGIDDSAELIDVDLLIKKLYTQYLPDAKKRGLQLDLDARHSLGSVFTSNLYLEELLQNFITNALKYTREGSVTVQAYTEKDRVYFNVKDTGIGISKADRDKIFKKFYRSEDYRTRETGGTGLGLYVAKKLADKLGCQITLSSRLNHGSTFGFSLPISAKKNHPLTTNTPTFPGHFS